MAPTHSEILATFRKDLEARNLIHDGDTIGTDDGTLGFVIGVVGNVPNG